MRDDLHQLHEVDRIEEMHPDQAPRFLERGRDAPDGEGRGVRGEQRAIGCFALDLREDPLLDGHLLHHGLDDDVGVADGLREVRVEVQAAVDGGAVRFGEFAPLQPAGEQRLDLVAGVLERFIPEVVESHFATGERRHIRDAVPHGAGADHRDLPGGVGRCHAIASTTRRARSG